MSYHHGMSAAGRRPRRELGWRQGIALALLANVTLFGGCLGRDSELSQEGKPCVDRFKDCPLAMACEYDFCRTRCDISADCGEDRHCIAALDSMEYRVCSLPGEQDCRTDADCPEALYCSPSEGRCREGCCVESSCSVRTPCATGYACSFVVRGAGVCVEAED